MGCGGSKIDDSPLVILCRERKDLVKTASDHRYALAAAHVSYFHSLNEVGEAIRRFVDEELVVGSSPSQGSPVLTLPSQEGKSKQKSRSSSPSTSISHSLDGSHHHKGRGEEEEFEDSHLQLSSTSSESDLNSDSGHMHIHNNFNNELEEEEGEERVQRERDVLPNSYSFSNYDVQENWGYNFPGINQYPYPYSNSYPNMYYMKRSATPAKTVLYEDPSVNGYTDYYGNGGFFGYPVMGSPPREASPPKQPPPSPPRASTWDFLNVFDTFEGGYPSYYRMGRYGYGSSTSSPDSKEVRAREGIPDLEDETENEVIKEVRKEKKVNGDERFVNAEFKGNVDVKRDVGEGTSKPVAFETSSESLGSVKGKGIKGSTSAEAYQSPDSIVSKTSEVEHVKKKGVSFEIEEASPMTMDVESSKHSSFTTLSTHGTRDVQEVVMEIKDEFAVASSYGKEVALLLEVSKLPYQRRSTPLKVIFSRILYLPSSHPSARPSQPISSRIMKMAKTYSADIADDLEMRPKSLSSTLEKLYAWEKKLYKEVKDEERLRITYEKECKRLKTLDERGAESSKIDASQASIRKLLTKINVCIRAVDSISSKIHKLRDEELQPQISELIYGLIRMWKSTLRCHQKQFQAIMDTKIQYLRANTGLQGDSGLKATLELEMELINWSTRFGNWINAQKLYVESLNEWLLRCLFHEPEETPDGIAPFSPGRIGAPSMFVVCNDWYQAMVRISEKGVENAMLEFASNLHQLWERHDEENRQRIKAEYLKKDFDKQLRTLRMERGKVKRELDVLSDKTMSKVPSESGVSPLDDLKVDLDSMRKKLEEERARHKEAAKLVHNAASSSLQAGLVPIFEALGNFTSEVIKSHEQVRLDYPGDQSR
ncbi:hypothetical protein K2173_023073 [Erythroxylum novogranatense]|uniref:Nitrate regulatory gene2 protein-like n=1 Tax=Erythroxylum novogranatense TaxID=1862640 RepID=A0AAV8TA35_9ROSI|nr:hypothetical protein K2173_023073 [Erythroxylum novogranatense]